MSVCDFTYPISMESNRVVLEGGGYQVSVVTLHYDEVSSSMKRSRVQTCSASERVSERVSRNFSFKTISISPNDNVMPYELLSPTKAGNNMARTRTYVVEFLGFGVVST